MGFKKKKKKGLKDLSAPETVHEKTGRQYLPCAGVPHCPARAPSSPSSPGSLPLPMGDKRWLDGLRESQHLPSSGLSPPFCFTRHPCDHLQIFLPSITNVSDSDLLLLIWSREHFLPDSYMASLVSVVHKSSLPTGQLGSGCLVVAGEGTCAFVVCLPRASSCQEDG